MKIFAVRHGQTDWNAKSKVQGRSDIPLNQEGRSQASETAEKLLDINEPIDLVVTSPLIRALETAEIIANRINAKLEVHQGFIERDFGVFEGMHFTQVDIYALRRWTDNVPTPNGETIREAASRVSIALDDILEKHSGKNIVIVAHGHVLRSIVWYFNGVPPDGEEQNFSVANCSIFEFEAHR